MVESAHAATRSASSPVVQRIMVRPRGMALPAADRVAWDAFVTTHADGTAFHETAWVGAVVNALRHPAWYLTARDDDGMLVGVLSLIEVKSRLFGHYLLAVPFASYGGPLGTPHAVEVLCREALALAAERGASLVELRGRRPLAQAPDTFDVSTRKLTVTLPLDGGSSAVFARFSSKLRAQIRRAEKDGVVVTVGPGQVDDFYAVYSTHMRDLGTPALPVAFFQRLADDFGDRMLFSIARLQGRPIACGAGFRYGGEFEITWASALRAHAKLSPNMAAYWRLIERLADDGVAVFNFGRCTADSGTHRFKRQWGGVDEVLPWYQWSPTTKTSNGTPAPGGKFTLAQQVWTKLPIPVANAIGPWVARLLP